MCFIISILKVQAQEDDVNEHRHQENDHKLAVRRANERWKYQSVNNSVLTVITGVTVLSSITQRPARNSPR